MLIISLIQLRNIKYNITNLNKLKFELPTGDLQVRSVLKRINDDNRMKIFNEIVIMIPCLQWWSRSMLFPNPT